MKIKQAFSFEFSDVKKGMCIFYSVLGLLLIFFLVLFTINGTPDSDSSFNSFEFSTYLFMFLMGCVMFNQSFHMTIQNGVSRRTMYFAKLLSFAAAAAIATVINVALIIGGAFLPDHLASFRMVTLLDVSYGLRMDFLSPAGSIFLTFMTFFLLMLLAAIGNFFAASYYKMTKSTAIVVSICVPVILFAAISLDVLFLNSRILTKLLEAFNFISGLGLLPGTAFAPWRAPVSCLILSGIFFGITWLIIRRMDIKK